MDTFQIDGIRLDNTLGFYKPDDRGHGLPKLLSEVRAHLSGTKNNNFSLILEHSWDYDAIDVVNKVGATSCWLDPYRSRNMDYLGNRPEGRPQIEPGIMRLLDSGRDFGLGRAPTIYIENHDHKRFMLKAGGRSTWYLTQPYVIALFTSPGATLIYNGQEFGMSNDMPEQGDGRVIPRPLDWNLRTSDPGPTLFDLYRRFIGLRRDHAGLRSSNFYPSNWDESDTQRNEHGFGIDRTNNIVVYHRWGDNGTGRTERFYIALNFSNFKQHISFEVASPGPWTDLM
jgi:glycosidase